MEETEKTLAVSGKDCHDSNRSVSESPESAELPIWQESAAEGDKDNPKCSLLPEPQPAPRLGHSSDLHGDATTGHWPQESQEYPQGVCTV